MGICPLNPYLMLKEITMLEIAPVENHSFNEVQELLDYCDQEKRNITYEDVSKFNGSFFEDDCRIGDLRFNENGMQSFLQRLGGGSGLYDTLKNINRPGLATQVVNDLMETETARENFGKSRFVIDAYDGNIIGMVGLRYSPLHNFDVVQNIMKDRDLVFDKALVSNTRLSLHFLDSVHGMELNSHGLDGKDTIKFGTRILNDLIGRTAIRGSVCTERTLCTNGMVHVSDMGSIRQIHVGDNQRITDRFGEIIELCKNEYEVIKEKFETLGKIEFKPQALVQLGCPFDILPEIRKERLFKPSSNLRGDDRTDAVKKATDFVSSIPSQFGGETTRAVWNSAHRNKSTMFDFIETFTEAANSDHYDPMQKLEIQEKAGELTNWTLNHRGRIENYRDLPVAA
jgi:hypothetical protein